MAEREAEERGNRYLLGQIRVSQAWAALASGDPERAQRLCGDTMREWDGDEITSICCYALWTEWHRLLYDGKPHAALASMRRAEKALARSGFERVPPTSVGLRLTRANIELACSSRAGDALCRSAARRARQLEKLSTRWARPSAALIRAGLARRANMHDDALRLYGAARQRFSELKLEGHAAAAAYREAQLRGELEHPEQAASAS